MGSNRSKSISLIRGEKIEFIERDAGKCYIWERELYKFSDFLYFLSDIRERIQ